MWRDNTPVSVIFAGTPEKAVYLETDHLGSPVRARNQAGALVWRWESDAFGAVQPHEDPLNTGQATTINLRFPGQYYDRESGLNYNVQRYYDPRLGRYMSPDPIGVNGGKNLYAYVNSNPLSWIDTTGNIAIAPVLTWGVPIVAGAVWAALNPGARQSLSQAWDTLATWAKPPENALNPEGPKAPGPPGPDEGFADPKGGPNWVPNPNPRGGGSSYGWEDDKGRVWCPTGQAGRAHGGPHWDVQVPGGRNVNVRPGQNINDLLK